VTFKPARTPAAPDHWSTPARRSPGRAGPEAVSRSRVGPRRACAGRPGRPRLPWPGRAGLVETRRPSRTAVNAAVFRLAR